MSDLVPVEESSNGFRFISAATRNHDGQGPGELYGVTTAQLKRAVKRNIERFPPDFMFELTGRLQMPIWHLQ